MRYFNAHSERWEYLDPNSAARETLDFIDTPELELIPEDTLMYLY